MTAKVGFPKLRLIGAAIGKIGVQGLAPGTWREISPDAPWTDDARPSGLRPTL